MLHTHLFSEASIEYFLEAAEYDLVGEWIFGQDMMDIHRLLKMNLQARYPKELERYIDAKLGGLIDPLQAILDEASFSDSRHIIARKR